MLLRKSVPTVWTFITNHSRLWGREKTNKETLVSWKFTNGKGKGMWVYMP